MHHLIQILFLWRNSHLHKFESAASSSPDFYNDMDSDMDSDGGYGGLPESTEVKDYLKQPKDKMLYEYDFGDGWEHIIELEKKVPKENNKAYPYCVTGRSMAPFDDCGGIDGFYDLLEAVENKDHPEHNDMKEWLADCFGVTDLSERKFDKDELNEAIDDNMPLFE
ncbi:unnamed protein product [Mucor hiemalis]